MQQQISEAKSLAAAMQAACIGVRVGRLQRLVGRRFDQALRPLGLSISQMEVLSALTLMGTPIRPGELAAALNIERSTMSRNLALMEQHGLVATTEKSATGRSTKIGITALGSQTLADATAAWSDAQDSVAGLVGPDAAGTLDGWIAALNAPEPNV